MWGKGHPFNVKGVKTPTMIQHGEADVRVPISQGYEFYNAIKTEGVPTPNARADAPTARSQQAEDARSHAGESRLV